LQGDEAQFKKIFKIDLSQQGDDGYVAKEEAGSLNINDPSDLNADPAPNRWFCHYEDVLNTTTIIQVSAFLNHRPHEVLLLKLDQPLNLDPRVGIDSQRKQATVWHSARDV